MSPALENLLWVAGPAMGLAALVLLVRRGKAGRKGSTLTWFLSLLLLAYFLITASLGIFWVARQELPVFDLHYLFGYLTMALVLLHVIAHRRPLLALFRRGSAGDDRSWRGRGKGAPRSWPIWLLALALAGAIGYGLGWRSGSHGVQVRLDAPLVTQPADIPAATQGQLRRVLVRDRSGNKEVLAMHYHLGTRHTRRSVLTGGGLDLSRRPATFKLYPGQPSTPLPRQKLPLTMPTGQAVEAHRLAPRGISSAAISLAQLSTLLHMTNGVTRRGSQPGGDLFMRAAPSAGALYPTETYVLVTRVEGLAPGLYHFGIKDDALRLIKGDASGATLAASSDQPALVRDAPAVLIFTSVFARSAWKYRARAWRYTLLDAGHLAIQAGMAAAALSLASHPLGAFDDARVNKLLGLDEAGEGALLILPLGHPTRKTSAGPLPHFRAAPRKLQLTGVPDLIALAHGMTTLAMDGELPPSSPPPNPTIGSVPPPGALVPLPRERPPGAALGPTILRRRSVRRFSDRALTQAELGSLIHHSFGQSGTPPRPDPSPRGGRRLGLYLAVHNVQGLTPGVYAYHPGVHALSLVRRQDNLSNHMATASLYQKVVGRAGVVFVLTLDSRHLPLPDGDRGYRYAALEAGFVGGLVYLQATALGLGCTGIGAFFDDEVAGLVGSNPTKEPVIYLLAVGAPAAPPRPGPTPGH